MATRKIIRIDEDLCNGCGDCVVGCAEGALQIIAGKARLVREDFCDGFGACLGACPVGALTVEERECDDFDAKAQQNTKDFLKTLELTPSNGVELQHRVDARSKLSPSFGGGYPESTMRVLPRAGGGLLPPIPHPSHGTEEDPTFSLTQWPIQLHLINPSAPFLKNRELVILSTCAPVAMPDANHRFVHGRSVALACPKLDRTDPYVDKLAAILREPTIPRAIVVRMEVPCCGGLTGMVVRAAQLTGRDDLEVVETIVGIQGEVIQSRPVWPPTGSDSPRA